MYVYPNLYKNFRTSAAYIELFGSSMTRFEVGRIPGGVMRIRAEERLKLVIGGLVYEPKPGAADAIECPIPLCKQSRANRGRYTI